MAKLIREINFKSEASHPIQALVLIFDLGGFSKFFSQPDVNQYVPKFLNRVFDCMSVIINGGTPYWSEIAAKTRTYEAFLPPVHQKLLGDGALYIWTFHKGLTELEEEELVDFVNKLWILKNNFNKILSKCSDDVPVIDLPNKIRFGLSAGSVYKLTYANSTQTEYIGYPINLASRLQSYCRDLGFIASGRINLREKTIAENNYIKVVAKNLKGFPKEIVIIDKNEYEGLDPQIKDELFEQLSIA